MGGGRKPDATTTSRSGRIEKLDVKNEPVELEPVDVKESAAVNGIERQPEELAEAVNRKDN